MIQCKGLHKVLGKRTRLYTNCSLDLLDILICSMTFLIENQASGGNLQNRRRSLFFDKAAGLHSTL